MSLASLMYMDSPVYPFEHMMSHRTFFGVMSPLPRFSVLPYRLDPMVDPEINAGWFQLNHQQAHNDAYNAMPSQYNFYNYPRVRGGPPPVPPAQPEIIPPQIGLPNGQMYVDNPLESEDSRKWWEFANMVEHQVLTGTILPQFPGQNTRWTYPFW